MTNDYEITFRNIRLEDNSELERIIRTAMTEFDADPKTTIIGDPTLKTMYQNFQKPRTAYFIVEVNGKLAGGCGVAPLDGGDERTCELQRMFLTKEMRGHGIGNMLMDKCIAKAQEFGFDEMYLETLSGMITAISLYEKFGFKTIEKPMGSTGHSGCNRYMILELGVGG